MEKRPIAGEQPKRGVIRCIWHGTRHKYYSISCIKWEIVKYINTYVLCSMFLFCAQCNGHDPFFLSGDICKFRPYTIWVVQWRFGLANLIPQTLYYLPLYPILAQNYGKEAHCRRTALKEGFSGIFHLLEQRKYYNRLLYPFIQLFDLILFYAIWPYTILLAV